MSDFLLSYSNFAQDKDLLRSHVIQTRNSASNHRSRAVIPTTQLCDDVCECLLEL